MFFYRLRRINEILFSKEYRRVLLCRLLCYLLRRLNPNIQYLGLVNRDEATFLFLSDNVVTPYTVAYGNFQRSDVDKVISLCSKYHRLNGDYFLDVGANIGTSTLYAMHSGKFKHAISIEPAPSNQAVLRLNMFANGFLADKVRIMNMAVSDRKGSMKLAISSANCGDHRLDIAPVSTEGESVQVEVDTLDRILATANVKANQVGVVWVDTQGHEGFVLDGAESLILQGVPFCIEFWPQALTQAGCYERLLKTIETKFEFFIELGPKSSDALAATSKIREFAKHLEGTIYHTDLLIFPKMMV